jgi:hypothetical protein
MPAPEPIMERLLRRCVIRQDGCIIWSGKMKKGYGAIARGRKFVGTHRLSYEFFCGPIPDGLFVLHKCDVRSCCNPDHLFLGNAQDNTDDMIKKGRMKAPPTYHGEDHPRAKLSQHDVQEIRKSNQSTRELMIKYGMSQVQVDSIRRGASWRLI